MGLTKKKHYDSYTLAYKLNAVKLSQRKGVRAIDVATSLGIHPVMLYRWRQEFKEGRLSENKHMRKPPPEKPRPDTLRRSKPLKSESQSGKGGSPRRKKRSSF